ncbi:hypothetical protein DPMN_059899 [Dreissena polymorpha]|uniref:Uncharacterized protein n=1 Tax=Dreissena polymorpha TaxID=45954 RepID=A0A9D4C4T1_DREPO|nr:hypothetical protein DPMN_059899 [Dreissena polymorpha]
MCSASLPQGRSCMTSDMARQTGKTGGSAIHKMTDDQTGNSIPGDHTGHKLTGDRTGHRLTSDRTGHKLTMTGPRLTADRSKADRSPDWSSNDK